LNKEIYAQILNSLCSQTSFDPLPVFAATQARLHGFWKFR